jgi:hypothetical protein
VSPDASRKPTCFVIMPFGVKTGAALQPKHRAEGPIDFDNVYENFIKKAIEALGITCVRCDETVESGRIHRKMFEQVFAADVAVVDITQLNANVFYELGVRHALRSHTTVLIKNAGTTTPFNIVDLDIVEYDIGGKLGVNVVAERKMAEQIKAGLRSGKHDSPVHDVLDITVVQEPHELRRTTWHEYRVRSTPDKRVGYVTGNLLDVREVDVWVSSENTDMEPARLMTVRSRASSATTGPSVTSRTATSWRTPSRTHWPHGSRNGRVEPGHVVATTPDPRGDRPPAAAVLHRVGVLHRPQRGAARGLRSGAAQASRPDGAAQALRSRPWRRRSSIRRVNGRSVILGRSGSAITHHWWSAPIIR